jgi:hypothetical protein
MIYQRLTFILSQAPMMRHTINISLPDVK